MKTISISNSQRKNCITGTSVLSVEHCLTAESNSQLHLLTLSWLIVGFHPLLSPSCFEGIFDILIIFFCGCFCFPCLIITLFVHYNQLQGSSIQMLVSIFMSYDSDSCTSMGRNIPIRTKLCIKSNTVL